MSIEYLTKVPNDLDPIQDGQATPMWYAVSDLLWPYTPTLVTDALEKERKSDLNFTFHDREFWKCSDRANYAASKLRCICPGLPVGILIGDAKQFICEPHAIICYWNFIGNEWTCSLYDPKYGPVTDFLTKIAFLLPRFRPNIGQGEKKIFKPFADKAAIESGWIMLYHESCNKGGYDTGKFGDIINDLNRKNYTKCPEPIPNAKVNLLLREDRSFWVYNQLRSRYKRAAIALAWGTNKIEPKKENKDRAVLVVWKNNSEYVLFDPDRGQMNATDFEAKLILG